jgi:radical SAM superfamily enzyme YgiQ (UPF0313 family)
MDILLIYPPLSVEERYARNVGNVGGHLPPLGIAQLAAFLIEKGFKANIIDALASNLSVDDIIKKIEQEKPKVVGISSLTSTFSRAIETAKAIKERFPEIMIIIGGHHATIIPREVIEENSCFDLLVYGEGELTLLEIMQKYKKTRFSLSHFLSKYKILNRIDGICFREKNNITTTKRRELIKDINILPFPARHLLPMDRYIPLPNQYKRYPVIHMVVIRGCPYNCTFCSNNAIFGRKVRARSPKKVVEEIRHVMKEYGARDISFWDDMMTTNRKWMMDFCNLLIQEKIDITWTCYSRVDTIDEDLLRKMKEAGCWNIFFGYESGSQSLLNNINKRITLEQIRNANELCKKVGIEIRASFMLALPGETPKLAQKTIDFAKELNPEYAQFCITTPFPGTQLYTDAKKYGTLTEDFSEYNIWKPVFIPKGYKNRKEIEKMERKAMSSFYVRPRFILDKIKSIRSLEDIKRYIRGFRLLLGFIQ